MEVKEKVIYIPGAKLKPWIDPRLVVCNSPTSGQGMFAREAIWEGEIVVRWGGTIYTKMELLAGKANPDTISILDENLYLADPVGELTDSEYFLNHSCDPNLWMVDAVRLAARRDIARGEELTADYALWLFETDWTIEKCKCGSRLCRGRISGNDWQFPELQERYAGHFVPFLNLRIADWKKT